MRTYQKDWDQSEELPMRIYICLVDGEYHHAEDYEEDAQAWVEELEVTQ